MELRRLLAVIYGTQKEAFSENNIVSLDCQIKVMIVTGTVSTEIESQIMAAMIVPGPLRNHQLQG